MPTRKAGRPAKREGRVCVRTYLLRSEQRAVRRILAGESESGLIRRLLRAEVLRLAKRPSVCGEE